MEPTPSRLRLITLHLSDQECRDVDSGPARGLPSPDRRGDVGVRRLTQSVAKKQIGGKIGMFRVGVRQKLSTGSAVPHWQGENTQDGASR